MSKSSIEWTDETWNPIAGCRKVSAGCKHCYAERMAQGVANRAARLRCIGNGQVPAALVLAWQCLGANYQPQTAAMRDTA